MPLGNLRKILFTDESRICIDNCNGRKFGWRRKNEVLLSFVLLNLSDAMVHLLWYRVAFHFGESRISMSSRMGHRQAYAIEIKFSMSVFDHLQVQSMINLF